ncbi:LRR receptor-like serine/threonine-protein kinase [Rhizoctonia solani]|uniref:LRR receptor-like serine/threonine-protein kinase n=1 Tax=Rhizoctonia solani TaxID=456999 RepID=A0A8H8SW02_9AGAM|nr:LRR receptor-like serine/threonine-protein kinase [Rhizoctonia solani]QRW18688.1 LRR receptor-like serine/threonine-protein kinase [Rhizoctonia solani]
MEGTSPSNRNLALRVFGIPELVGIICNLIQKRDNANPLRVCRQLFQGIRPYIWRSTDAVITLIEMIPTSRVEEPFDEPFCPYVASPPARSPRESLDLSRLNIYGPYIKQLKIPVLTIVDEYHDWNDFLVSVRNVSLLPNLEHLELDVSREIQRETISTESLNWMTTFMSPSLKTFQIFLDITLDVFSNVDDFSDTRISIESAINILQMPPT